MLHACRNVCSPVHPYTQDVWFDSGTSWAGCLDADAALGLPADLYLEGSDQHRGCGARRAAAFCFFCLADMGHLTFELQYLQGPPVWVALGMCFMQEAQLGHSSWLRACVDAAAHRLTM